MTRHAAEDRLERLTWICMNIGRGEIIKVMDSDEKTVMCLTDTGVLMIKDKATQNTLITAYIPTVDKVYLMYDGHPPRWIVEKVKKAQKAYRRRG